MSASCGQEVAELAQRLLAQLALVDPAVRVDDLLVGTFLPHPGDHLFLRCCGDRRVLSLSTAPPTAAAPPEPQATAARLAKILAQGRHQGFRARRGDAFLYGSLTVPGLGAAPVCTALHLSGQTAVAEAIAATSLIDSCLHLDATDLAEAAALPERTLVLVALSEGNPGGFGFSAHERLELRALASPWIAAGRLRESAESLLAVQISRFRTLDPNGPIVATLQRHGAVVLAHLHGATQGAEPTWLHCSALLPGSDPGLGA